MSDKPLMTLTEVAAFVGVHRSTLYGQPALLRRLQARNPIGRRKYARVLVERLKTDESLSQLGSRRA